MSNIMGIPVLKGRGFSRAMSPVVFCRRFSG
jgi:hypothetical protein